MKTEHYSSRDVDRGGGEREEAMPMAAVRATDWPLQRKAIPIMMELLRGDDYVAEALF